MIRGGIGCCPHEPLESLDAPWVSWCPFCLWSVTYHGSANPADLEQLLEEHLGGHVEEMMQG